MDCLFCSIKNRNIPAEIVYEDPGAVAFLDVHPRAPGHTIVVPKRHVETILELPDQDLDQLFRAVKEVTRALREAFLPDGFTIGWNHGRKAGQMVEHLHVHVMPRFKDDKGGSIHGVVDNPPQESLQQIGDKIRTAITNN